MRQPGRPNLAIKRIGCSPPGRKPVEPDLKYSTSYLDGKLVLEIKEAVENELRDALPGLQPEEAAVLAMLRGRLAKEVALGAMSGREPHSPTGRSPSSEVVC